MQFLAYGLRRLAFLRADSLADHLPPRIICYGLPIGEGPSFEPGNRWQGVRFGRLPNFGQQTRLAKTRFAHNSNECTASLDYYLLQFVVYEPEFGSAAYKRRGQSLALQTTHLARHGLGS